MIIVSTLHHTATDYGRPDAVRHQQICGGPHSSSLAHFKLQYPLENWVATQFPHTAIWRAEARCRSPPLGGPHFVVIFLHSHLSAPSALEELRGLGQGDSLAIGAAAANIHQGTPFYYPCIHVSQRHNRPLSHFSQPLVACLDVQSPGIVRRVHPAQGLVLIQCTRTPSCASVGSRWMMTSWCRLQQRAAHLLRHAARWAGCGESTRQPAASGVPAAAVLAIDSALNRLPKFSSRLTWVSYTTQNVNIAREMVR